MNDRHHFLVCVLIGAIFVMGWLTASALFPGGPLQ